MVSVSIRGRQEHITLRPPLMPVEETEQCEELLRPGETHPFSGLAVAGPLPDQVDT